MSSVTQKSVLVIGAGVAGLTAAAQLNKNPEFNVTLLEATNRIGGRVYSKQIDDAKVEIGAQWVHGEKDNSVFAIAQPLGILDETVDMRKLGPSSMFVTQSGEFLPESVHDKVERAMEDLHVSQDFTEGKECLGNYASRAFWRLNELDPISEKIGVSKGVLDWIHRFQNTIDGSDNWFVPSCQGQIEYKSCDGNPTIPWKPPAVYETLLEIILHGEPKITEIPIPERIPDWIHLNHEVTEVHYSSCGTKRVKVTCRNGTSFLVDHVICTVSLGVLKHHHAALFDPMLPREKVSAIENIEFGTVDKIYITFESVWWPENSIGFNFIWENTDTVKDNWLANPTDQILATEFDGVPVWCRSLLGLYPVKTHPKMLVAWITGPPARFMERMDPCDLKRDLSTVLKTFVGGIFKVSEITSVEPSRWHSNPFTRGSYSYRSVESEEKKVWATQIAEPIADHTGRPVICFAGEATHPHFFSTVHGAHDTGIREAERLVKHYVKIRQQEAEEDFPVCCTLVFD